MKNTTYLSSAEEFCYQLIEDLGNKHFLTDLSGESGGAAIAIQIAFKR